MNDMQTFLVAFRRTIEDATSRLLDLPEKQSETPRAAGKWSPKEIIGHLIDSAANNHVRFIRAQQSDELLFPGYEQEEWVRLQNYNAESWERLVRLWSGYNLHLHHLMSQVSAERLQVARTRHNLHQIAWQAVAETEPVTLEYFLRDYVGHLESHLRQIFD